MNVIGVGSIPPGDLNLYAYCFRGMTVTSGTVVINKDSGNLIGISIGGGAPLCPCLYIVQVSELVHCLTTYQLLLQVFDNTPAAKDGTLESGDELVGVNGVNVKGKTKVEVAKMIQVTLKRHKGKQYETDMKATEPQVVIKYNKLHADPKQGKTLDLILKKVKIISDVTMKEIIMNAYSR